MEGGRLIGGRLIEVELYFISVISVNKLKLISSSKERLRGWPLVGLTVKKAAF